jgi:hypothetical protein
VTDPREHRAAPLYDHRTPAAIAAASALVGIMTERRPEMVWEVESVAPADGPGPSRPD